jgi:hypothetical protein
MMPDRGDVKEKAKKIIKVLPGLNCGKCGFDNCGKFARAVAEGRTPCYGCVSGGPSVANKVCEIMGVRVPEKVKIPVGYPGFSQPGMASAGMNRGRGRGLGRSQGMRRGPGRSKGFSRRRSRSKSGR